MHTTSPTLRPPPTPRQMRHITAALTPWRALVEPIWSGLDAIPDERPLLFVGNHTLFGFLDVPMMFTELYERHKICLRALGDHVHFQVPFWGSLLNRYGAVDGTRPNCAALMRNKASILVFPGGGREVAKRKGEKNTLIWKNRIGFVKLAIAHGCTIVPFSAVGIEDAYDIRFDTDQLMKTPIGSLVRRAKIRSDVIPPIVTGIGPTLIPKPHRLYFHFSKPIVTRHLCGQEDDLKTCYALRDEVRSSIMDGISKMRQKQSEDPPVLWTVQTLRAARQVFRDLRAYQRSRGERRVL